MILLDTSGVLAVVDALDPDHHRVRAALAAGRPPLLLSPFVLAEVDHIVTRNVGIDAELAFLEEVARDAYRLAPFAAADIAVAKTVIVRHRDLRVGLADASIVVLSRRHDVHDVLTLDERHFRVLRGARDRPFRLLPADT